MNTDPLCTEDMIQDLLILLTNIADEYRHKDYEKWEVLFLEDSSLVIQLAVLSMAQSMLIMDGKLTDIVRHLEKQQ